MRYKAPTSFNEPTRFINVDLHIRGSNGLPELLAAFGDKAFDLHTDGDLLLVELNGTSGSNLEDTLLGFINLIESLEPSARTIWNSASLRRFDIGIQCEREPHAAHFYISPEAVQGLNRIAGEIEITIYAPYAEKTKLPVGA